MKKVILIMGLAICYLISYSQQQGTFKDPRDGKIYKTVKIGKQTWFAENLAFKTDKGCWAYENNPNNVAQYGYLYCGWCTDSIAPKGWHLPTKQELLELYQFLGGEDEKVYNSIIQGGNSGFNCLFGGFRIITGQYMALGNNANFWSVTAEGESSVWTMECMIIRKKAYLTPHSGPDGYSVRCVKD